MMKKVALFCLGHGVVSQFIHVSRIVFVLILLYIL